MTSDEKTPRILDRIESPADLKTLSLEELQKLAAELRETMWQNAGLVRDKASLSRALSDIASLKETTVAIRDHRDTLMSLELRSMLAAATFICRAALKRTETRGAHHRSDYPEENSRWLRNIVFSMRDAKVSLHSEPVDLTKVSP